MRVLTAPGFPMPMFALSELKLKTPVSPIPEFPKPVLSQGLGKVAFQQLISSLMGR